MAKGVFIHNAKSKYDDQPERYYHFPKQYLSRVKPFVGDWILYYESGKNKGRKSYTALAKVNKIVPDIRVESMYYALIEANSYLSFERLVPFKTNGVIANSFLQNADGSLNNGRQVWAVRSIPDVDFYRIVDEAFPDEIDILPREDSTDKFADNVEENVQTPFELEVERVRVEVKLTRVKRDKIFRHHVLSAYKKRCAFTGLSFINGGGRAEVQAAHIKPVKDNGPDSIKNGLALSGTAHWMFDRGLLSISNEHDILVSRHVNNIDEVDRLLTQSRKLILPQNREDWPHPHYLGWHRDNCFKQ